MSQVPTWSLTVGRLVEALGDPAGRFDTRRRCPEQGRQVRLKALERLSGRESTRVKPRSEDPRTVTAAAALSVRPQSPNSALEPGYRGMAALILSATSPILTPCPTNPAWPS